MTRWTRWQSAFYWFLVLVLTGCSSESINTAVGVGGQAGAAGSSTGGIAGAGGALTGGAGGALGGSAGSDAAADGGGSGGTGGTVTPACAPSEAITKAALSQVSWIWQSYSDQKLGTNQCIACKGTPCATGCTLQPVLISWDKPAAGWVAAQGDASCADALIRVGSCGSEIECQLGVKSGTASFAALPEPTATGWKLTGVKMYGAGYVNSATFSGACGSGWIDVNALGAAVGVALPTAFEGAEFPCP
jgi:hypothetical protein